MRLRRKKAEIHRRHEPFSVELYECGYKEFKKRRRNSPRFWRIEGFTVNAASPALRLAFGKYIWKKPVIGILGEYDALPNLSQEGGRGWSAAPLRGQHYGQLAAGTTPQAPVLWAQL